MRSDVDNATPHEDVIVAWLDDRGQQVSFVARKYNDGFWYANGARIATPTHWAPLPRIDQ